MRDFGVSGKINIGFARALLPPCSNNFFLKFLDRLCFEIFRPIVPENRDEWLYRSHSRAQNKGVSDLIGANCPEL